MNRKLITILLVVTLIIGGAASLFAEESLESSDSSLDLTNSPSFESPPNPSGIGNGGGGNPG